MVLSTASPLLRSLIHDAGASSPYAATSLTLTHTPLIPLLHLLHTLYHPPSALSIPPPEIIPTMRLARQLQAYGVLSACEAHTAHLLSPSTLLPLYTAACHAHEGLALNAITDFLIGHMREVLSCAEFDAFPPFLREVIGALVHDSEGVAKEEGSRAELIRLFHSRVRPRVEVAQVKVEEEEQGSVVKAVEGVAAKEGVVDDVTLTQLIRKQRAQPLFDALTSLCSLFFTPEKQPSVHAGKAGQAAEAVDDLALSFGAPPTVKVGGDDDDSDSDWSTDDEDDDGPSTCRPLTFPSSSPPSHLSTKPTSPRHRLHDKMGSAFTFPPTAKTGELHDCSLIIQTAAKPPKHPRLNRSCPLRRNSEGPAVALIPPRVRRPSAPSIY